MKKILLTLSIIILIGAGCVETNESSGKNNIYTSSKTNTEKEFLFNKKMECNNICKKLYLENEANADKNMTVFNPTYSYNAELNTCLYAGGIMDSNTEISWVLDCFTNKELLSYAAVGDNVIVGLSYELFNAKKDILMNN